MGRIKTQQTKRITLKLLEKHKEKFTDNFEENKKLTSELLDIDSKKIRNIVAGYATRLIRNDDGM